jgi:hypothetical protein
VKQPLTTERQRENERALGSQIEEMNADKELEVDTKAEEQAETQASA